MLRDGLRSSLQHSLLWGLQPERGPSWGPEGLRGWGVLEVPLSDQGSPSPAGPTQPSSGSSTPSSLSSTSSARATSGSSSRPCWRCWGCSCWPSSSTACPATWSRSSWGREGPVASLRCSSWAGVFSPPLAWRPQVSGALVLLAGLVTPPPCLSSTP